MTRKRTRGGRAAGAVRLLALVCFALGSGVPSNAPAQEDDWGLKHDDKKEKKDKKAGKKKTAGVKKEKGAKKAKKTAATPPDGGKTAAGGADGKGIALFKELLKDPLDRFLAQEVAEALGGKGADMEAAAAALAASLPQAAAGSGGFLLALGHACIAAGDTAKAAELIVEAKAKGGADGHGAAFLEALLETAKGNHQGAASLLEGLLAGIGKGGGASTGLASAVQEQLTEAALAAGDAPLAASAFAASAAATCRLGDAFDLIVDRMLAGDMAGEARAFVEGVVSSCAWSKYERHLLDATLARVLAAQGDFGGAMKAAGAALASLGSWAGDCGDLVTLYLESAAELGTAAQGAAGLMKKKDACVVAACAAWMEDFAGPQDALPVYEQALAKLPKDAGLAILYAGALAKTGQAAKAAALLEEKIAKLDDPGLVDALGALLEQSKGKDGAVKALAELGAKSKKVWLHVALEQYFDEAGAPLSAKKENELLVQLDPGNPEHLVRLGERLFREGKTGEALAAWHKTAALFGAPKEGKLQLADILLDHNFFKEAGELYLALAKESPKDPAVAAKVAVYYQASGKPGDAVGWWSAVLGDAEAGFSARYEAALRLVQLYKMLGALKQKKQEVQSLVERNPDDPVVKLFQAELLCEADELDAGSAAAAAILDEGGAPADVAQAALAVVEKAWKLKGQPAGFAAAVGAYVEKFPEKKAQVLMKLAQESAAASDFDAAAAQVAQALALAPGEMSLQEKAAELYLGMGRHEEAIAALKLVTAADPTSWGRMIDLADALAAVGKGGEAAGLLEKVVQKCGDQALLDRAFTLLFTLEGGAQGGLSSEPYLAKLYKKTHSERLLGRLFEVYDSMLDADKAKGAGGCTGGSGGGGGGGGGADCGWVARAASFAGGVIIDGPEGMRYQAARLAQGLALAQAARSLLVRAAGAASPAVQVLAIAASAAPGRFPGKEGKELFAPFRSSGDRNVWRAAAVAAALCGAEDEWGDLVPAFDDKDPETRAAAILAAGIVLAGGAAGQKPPGLGAALDAEVGEVFHERQFNAVYHSAVWVAGLRGGDEAFASMRAMYETLGSEPSGTGGALARRMVLRALGGGRFDDEKTAAFLVRETLAEPEALRETAGFALHAVACRAAAGGAGGGSAGCAGMEMPGMGLGHPATYGDFKVRSLFEGWVVPGEYIFDGAELPYALQRYDAVLGEEASGVAESEAPTDDDFRRIGELLFSGRTPGGVEGWHTLAAHVGPSQEAALVKALDGVLAGHRDALLGVLGRAAASAGMEARALLPGLVGLAARLSPDEAPPPLAAIAAGSPGSPEGAAAIAALGTYGTAAAVDALRKVASASDWVVRLAVVAALAQEPTAESCALLGAIAAKDPSLAVREKAQSSLAACP